MAFTNYTGNVPSALALNYTQNIPVSGGASISGSRIDSVIATLGMSTNAYTNTYSVRVRLIDQYGGTLAEVSRADIKFTSGNYGQAYFDFTFGTSFDVNAIRSIDVYGLSDATKIFVKSSQSVGITYTVRTACTPPDTVTLSRGEAEPNGAATLSWSGAGAGAANGIIGYWIQRSDNGAAWDNTWTQHGYLTKSMTVYAHPDYGKYYNYRLVTEGEYINSAPSTVKKLTTLTPTACGAPSAATLSGTVAETAPTLTYSGASSGTINGITGYEIQYAESTNNSVWGDWTALKTVTNGVSSGSTTVALSATRSYYRKYRIRTQGAAGATYYSGWKETGSCRYNSVPTAPTSFEASPAIYVSGNIALAYPGATDLDNNISTYNVQYATSADGISWGSWVSLANGATSHTPTLSPGYYIKYQVRTVDALGAMSGWKASNICGKNTAPAAPVISLPQNSKTIHNSRPRFLITMGADPESHLQTLTADGFTFSRASGLAAGDKIIARKSTAAAAGAVSISALSTDQYGESSSAVAQNTTYAAPVFTDAAINKGTTRIKAAHINELRGMIANIQKYYGFDENLVDNFNFDTSTGWAANQNVTLQTVTFGEDKALRITCNQTASTPGLITTQNVDQNDYPLGVSHTIQIRVKSATASDVGLRVSLFGNTDLSFTALSSGWTTISLQTKVTTFAQPWLLIYFSSPSIGAAFDVSWISITKGSIPFVSGEMTWSGTITAGITKARGWKSHVIELQQAINDVVTLVNGWDAASTVNRIAAFAWISPSVKPSAAVMNQIRQVIAWL